jgi:peptidoglycan LD-endopeptidase LytH
VLGFAAGALCLTAGLWRAGALRAPLVSESRQPPEAPAAAAGSKPASPPTLSPSLPEAPQGPPSGPGQSGARGPSVARGPSGAQGQAERAVPEPGGAPHLGMPVQGINPKSLVDTFDQSRDGHQHEALDIPAARGTPVVAAEEGNVVKLFTSKQGGLTVYQFDDSGTYCYYYAHLDRYAPGLKEGVLLRKGEVLGSVGSTGDASADAPHLHFAVFKLGPEKKWWQGTPMDPLPLLR